MNIKEMVSEFIRFFYFKLSWALQSFEIKKNVVNQNVAMRQNSIFIQSSPILLFQESNYLELDFQLQFSVNNISTPLFELNQQPELSFQPLDIPTDSSNQRPHQVQPNSSQQTSHIAEIRPKRNRSKTIVHNSTAKSHKTKNICYNICQKTIKVIKKREYNTKLQNICKVQNISSSQFISHIVRIKNDFTGPKALQMYFQVQSPMSKVFKKFMKWFLQQKYLRHAINEGTMDDLKGYLQFKNEVIMGILQN